jgi:hypothetical protein
MNHLPPVLQLEILDFLDLVDRLDYSRVNRFCSRQLSSHVRIVALKVGRGLKDFLESKEFRNFILTKIKNPYKQLTLEGHGNWDFHPIPLTARSLKCSIVLKNFQLQRSQIQCLSLPISRDAQMNQISFVNSLQSLSGLKDLSLNCFFPIDLIPIIPQLERLQIQSFSFNAGNLIETSKFTNLQCLKLVNCQGFSDVSTLARIRELHLIECPDIRDISALNNNEIIFIHSSDIDDYSRSFRFSRVIDLLFNCRINCQVDLYRLELVEKLKMDYKTALLANVTFPILPPTLKSLTISNINSECSIPYQNNLREITIQDCPRFLLKNMRNIPFVHVQYCHQIKNWKPLQDNYCVTVTCCSNFDPSPLSEVRLLKVQVLSSLAIASDLTNITHLKLQTPISIFREGFFDKLAAVTTLREFEFEIDNTFTQTPDYEKFLLSLQKLDAIKRIVIKFRVERFSKLYDVFYHQIKAMHHRQFSVEVSSLSATVYLLPRKEEDTSSTLVSCRKEDDNTLISGSNSGCSLL